MRSAIELAERRLLPDALLRAGMRGLIRRRLREERAAAGERPEEALRAFAESLKREAVALSPEKANEQHYELPPEFFRLVMGRHMKYSGCWWPQGVRTLDEAEARMLELTCERAGVSDGMEILELGCGWGSLTLWMAERYPACRILAVSNSAPQRAFILARAAERGLKNLEVLTEDVNRFRTGRRFDRAVSVEMFEHMRNYEELLGRIAGWLKDGGRLFVHVFAHRLYAYPFGTERDDDWMGRWFFTAGLMPAHGLLPLFDRDLRPVRNWEVNGTHYQRTAEAWLANLDANRREAMKVLAGAYGDAQAGRWLQRWRMFFMACAELFGYRGGSEWQVSHYLFEKR